MLGKLNSQHTCKSCLSREHEYLNVVWSLDNSMNNHKASWFLPLWILAHEKPICSYEKPWRSILRVTLQKLFWLSCAEAPFWVTHQSCHLQSTDPLPSWLQKRARCMFSSGRSQHCMEGCSLRQDNVGLPAVKPQIAPRFALEINIYVLDNYV